MKIITKLWIGIVILIILSPLGLILPKLFKAKGAWGERKLSDIWRAPMDNYTLGGWQHKGFAYIISAVVGTAVIVAVALVIGKMLSKKDDQ